MTTSDGDSDPLWDAMLAAARGEFTLSAAVHDRDPRTPREIQLVDAALAAGVVGALAVLRDLDQEPPTRH